MEETKILELETMAFTTREKIIDMSINGGCFIGASLSCADILLYLYTSFLNVHPNNLKDENRDILLLSKGHDVPALYAVLANLNFIDPDRLKNHLQIDDHIYWHPNKNIPGVEFHSGSLGHLPAVGLGIAYDCKLKKLNSKIVVVLGDGELNEGSVWEALLVASAFKMENLLFIIDRNHFQANVNTEELIPLEPLTDKFEAFGAIVSKVDGHDFRAMSEVFSNLSFNKGKVNVVICTTIRGKGLPSIEAKADRWFVNFTKAEADELKKELHGQKTANLISEKLTVR